MSRTYCVENVWDLDEEFFNFNEPSFGPNESFAVGDLSISLKDYGSEMPSIASEMEFDAVETYIPGLTEVSPVVSSVSGSASLQKSTPCETHRVPHTVSMPAATLGYGPTSVVPTNADGVPVVNITPSKNEIAELRYSFYSSQNYLASVRQDVLVVPESQLLNSNNFTDSTYTPQIKPDVLRNSKTENKKDLVPPRGIKIQNDDLPSPQMMFSVLKFREALGTLDTDSLDEYMSRVNKYRTLSDEEKDELKLIYRRIKNRAAARRSRRDKRDHVADLEKEVKQLKSQVEHMRMELASLRAENTYLKDEIQFSAAIINSNPTLSQLYTETSRHLNSSIPFTASDPDHIEN